MPNHTRAEKLEQHATRLEPELMARLRAYVAWREEAGAPTNLNRAIAEMVDHGLKVRGH
jgi:hypothetical protein